MFKMLYFSCSPKNIFGHYLFLPFWRMIMLALKILDTKEFMNLLLRSTIFDSFLLYEATVKTSVTYEINGRYQKDFFDSLEDDLKPKEDFTWWESQKPHIFQWMKGKRTPLFFKISLLLSKENLNHFLLESNLPFSEDTIGGLFFHIQYDGNTIFLRDGVSFQTFTMDKSLEHAWSEYLLNFLKQHSIAYETLD